MSGNMMTTTMGGTGYKQFGKEVLCTQVRFSMLEAIFEVDNEVQRQLDPRKRREIRDFILVSLERGEPFYFSPFIYSSRRNIDETDAGFTLKPGARIFVLDGQHRSSALSSALGTLKAMKEAAEELGDEVKAQEAQRQIQQLNAYPVSMQIYLDLTQQEERQLFTDCNTERREAHAGLQLRYDQRDQYTELTRNVADRLKEQLDIEFLTSRVTEKSTTITSLITMRKCLIALFEGVLTVKTGDPYYRNCKQKDVPAIAEAFFASWPSVFPKNMADRKRYASGATGVQMALAYTVFTLTRERSISHKEAIRLLKVLKRHCSWRHDDPLFSHMYDKQSGRVRNHSNTTAVKRTMMKFLKVIHEEGKTLHDH
ncbi:DNA sulfur modification protein DndB [Sporosarcina cascadiensis]|uniref:DNA sulfur modification protein DndB n=1 Tax=Sporosarcina cascadiensis TaxID=2660747 RepID=UPI00129A27E7|nr:DNA sulfur modification protein DndB [Sporosarcina cascadiensis]